jgi:PIN domain nuclease of toxin-antitoxin system
MRLLLDTHAFLFAISSPQLLTANGRRLLTNPEIERWVSVVSLWEIAIKIHIGKLALPLDRSFYAQHLRALNAQTLAVDLRHSLALFGLPLHHRDPFDRLLIAQSLAEQVPLVSVDALFDRYGVTRLW